MYTLYYSPGACSLGIHVLLNELGQKYELAEKSKVQDFASINPNNTVPVLKDGSIIVQEGAAIALHLMEKHPSPMLPKELNARTKAIQWLMFANASVHPAYSKLFFVGKNVKDDKTKEELLTAGGQAISKLWGIVDTQLGRTPYLAGEALSMADLFLTVYANWNNYFPGKINIPAQTQKVLKGISARASFQQAIKQEGVEYKL